MQATPPPYDFKCVVSTLSLWTLVQIALPPRMSGVIILCFEMKQEISQQATRKAVVEALIP